MKTLQTILAALLLACVSGMFYGVLTVPGPKQNYAVAFIFILSTGCISLFYLTVKYTDNDDGW